MIEPSQSRECLRAAVRRKRSDDGGDFSPRSRPWARVKTGSDELRSALHHEPGKLHVRRHGRERARPRVRVMWEYRALPTGTRSHFARATARAATSSALPSGARKPTSHACPCHLSWLVRASMPGGALACALSEATRHTCPTAPQPPVPGAGSPQSWRPARSTKRTRRTIFVALDSSSPAPRFLLLWRNAQRITTAQTSRGELVDGRAEFAARADHTPSARADPSALAL